MFTNLWQFRCLSPANLWHRTGWPVRFARWGAGSRHRTLGEPLCENIKYLSWQKHVLNMDAKLYLLILIIPFTLVGGSTPLKILVSWDYYSQYIEKMFRKCLSPSIIGEWQTAAQHPFFVGKTLHSDTWAAGCAATGWEKSASAPPRYEKHHIHHLSSYACTPRIGWRHWRTSSKNSEVQNQPLKPRFHCKNHEKPRSQEFVAGHGLLLFEVVRYHPNVFTVWGGPNYLTQNQFIKWLK